MTLEIPNLNQNVENFILYKKGNNDYSKILNGFWAVTS